MRILSFKETVFYTLDRSLCTSTSIHNHMNHIFIIITFWIPNKNAQTNEPLRKITKHILRQNGREVAEVVPYHKDIHVMN